jgi:hypothetical protein
MATNKPRPVHPGDITLETRLIEQRCILRRKRFFTSRVLTSIATDSLICRSHERGATSEVQEAEGLPEARAPGITLC